jgi:hypothetical protein
MPWVRIREIENEPPRAATRDEIETLRDSQYDLVTLIVAGVSLGPKIY